MTTAAMLRNIGHDVIEAYSGQEALNVPHSGKSIDVVVTDQGMPNMTGLQLAEHIRESWPRLPIILATGYAELPKDAALTLPRLAKSFQQDELAAAIARLIKGRR
jgi:CheY-like chemotaxis protein